MRMSWCALVYGFGEYLLERFVAENPSVTISANQILGFIISRLAKGDILPSFNKHRNYIFYLLKFRESLWERFVVENPSLNISENQIVGYILSRLTNDVIISTFKWHAK